MEAVAVKKPKRRLSGKAQTTLLGYAFVAIPILGFCLFTLVPLCFSFFVCFNNYDFFTGDFSFVGWGNFARAFSDELFLTSLKNTAFVLVGLAVQIVVSLLLALLLTVNLKGQPIFRTFFFIPSLCSSVAVTLVWKWLYNQDFGILNTILKGMGLPAVGWLTDPKVAMVSMIIQGVWMGLGGGMVMYISALKNVPTPLYEAASLEGANHFQKFFSITLPMISPTTFYILTTSLIGSLTDFTRFRMMNDGGPYHSTLTTALYVYQTAFTSSYDYDYSYATTMAWILGGIIVVMLGLLFAGSKKWVHYNG